MKNKKADLSLSINAIVILILAITMLGLGLTFMRGIFKQMGSKVGEAVSASELTNPPNVDNVLTLAPSDLTLRSSKSEAVTAAFLNTAGSRSCGLKYGDSTSTGGTDVADLTYSSQTVAMTTDQINTWLVSVTAGTTIGTGIYTLVMECGSPLAEVARRDLLVTVTS